MVFSKGNCPRLQQASRQLLLDASKHRLERTGGQTSTSDKLTPATSHSTHNLRERPGNAEQYQGNGRMRTQRSGVPVCFYCKRKGHIISECRELEKKRGRLNPVNTIQRESNDGQSFNDVNNQKEVNPFILEGLVSLGTGDD